MRHRPGQRTRALTRIGEHMSAALIAGRIDEARTQAIEFKRLVTELRRDDDARRDHPIKPNKFWA